MKTNSGEQAPDLRPVDPESGSPLPEMKQPGYYPGYSTLAQQSYWDVATRRKILHRVNEVPPVRFFDPEQARLMEAVVGHVMPQDDRVPERRIPILPRVDERLFKGRIDGYRFASMPPDGDAYRQGLQAIEKMARQSYTLSARNPDQWRSI